jgi:oligopeptide/dipeptide ABC transporter ATP-binding protein
LTVREPSTTAPMLTKQRVGQTDGEPTLSVRDLNTDFPTRQGVIRAVSGVSFDIPRGSCVGIVGESGSGKSITALSIMGLVRSPGRIRVREMRFRGIDLSALTESEIRKLRGSQLALVPQQPASALNPVYSVGTQIAEAIRTHRGVSRAAAHDEAVRLLELVGIPDPRRRAREYPHRLSGGMQQRVSIAMALANGPDLVILDEPTTSLDVTIQAQVLDLIKTLRHELGMSVLLITHDFGVVAEMCDEVIVMYGGKVMEHGPVDQVIGKPLHPYTKGLLASMPEPAVRQSRLNVIAGTVPDPLHMPPGCPFAPRCPRAMEVCSTMPQTRMIDGRHVACWLF